MATVRAPNEVLAANGECIPDRSTVIMVKQKLGFLCLQARIVSDLQGIAIDVPRGAGLSTGGAVRPRLWLMTNFTGHSTSHSADFPWSSPVAIGTLVLSAVWESPLSK